MGKSEEFFLQEILQKLKRFIKTRLFGRFAPISSFEIEFLPQTQNFETLQPDCVHL